jgi:geranylgeranyl pyrophosphate synthase
MTTPPKINQQVQALLSKQGKPGLLKAKATIKNSQISPAIKEILTYFIEENWPNTHHPALFSLCCQAVNGNPKSTYDISASIVLLTGAADIHDDIIDKSTTKSQKQTAFGKYNKELVLLAGDALLFKGMLMLHNACAKFSAKKQKAIFDCVKKSFFNIGYAISSERCLRGKPFEVASYRKVVESKGGVTEACATIGAIIGNAKANQLDALRHYGQTLGVLMTLKNEFTDLNDPKELDNRRKNEILPLPLLYALKDASANRQLTTLLQGKMTKKKAAKIAEIAKETEKVQALIEEMRNMVLDEEGYLEPIKFNVGSLKLLLESSTADL